MYDYLYIFYFKFFEWRKDEDAKDSAIYGVMMAVFFHIFCIASAIIYFTEYNFMAETFGIIHTKYYWLPGVVVAMVVIHRIFKKRAPRILEKYQNDSTVFKFAHVVLSLLITFVPFALGAYFLNSK